MKRFCLLVLFLSLIASAAPAQQVSRDATKSNAVIVGNEEPGQLDKDGQDDHKTSRLLDKDSPDYTRQRLAELEKIMYEKIRREVIDEKAAEVPKIGNDAKAFYNEKDEQTGKKVFSYNQSEVDREVQQRLDSEVLLKNFGKDFFEEGELSQATLFSGLAPSGYQLGAGDELKIIIWSELGDETVYDVQVNPEGQVYVPIIGVIRVTGQTVGEFEQTVMGSLSGKFKHFKGQATLTKVRTIQIFVAGEVERPGAMNISGLATAFSALYQAGGPTQRGSMRRISVLDPSGKAKTIDLYRYLLSGDRSQDIAVKNGDTIFVPTAEGRVTVAGMVTRPAIYEIIDGNSLADVLLMAGNVLPKAYSGRVMVTRWTGDKRREAYDIKLGTAKTLEDFKVKNGDEINVGRATELVGNLVALEGPVSKPGDYSIGDGITISELLARAGGLIKEEANLEHGQIIRKGASGQQQIIAFNVKFALAGDKLQNHQLQAFDRVRLFAENEIKPDEKKISIDGAIRRPGQYIFRDGMKLADLVVNAQGLSIDAAGQLEVARTGNGSSSEIIKADVNAALADEKSAENIVLQPLDRISVPARGDIMIEPEMVVLKGQVMRPGPYALTHRGEKLSSLILRAGGLTQHAFADGTVFLRKVDNITSEKQLETTENVQDDMFRQATLDLRADLLRSGAKVDDLKTMSSEVEGEKIDEQVLAGTQAEKTGDTIQSLSNGQSSGYSGIEMRSRSLKNKMLRIPIPLQKIIDGKAEDFEDVSLFDGDQITIPVIPNTVSVLGAVMNSTTILFNNNKPASYYINRAGGFNGRSDHRRTIVVRASGEVFRMRRVKKIERGDIILVPPKPNLVKPDTLKELGNIAGILGNLAVTYKVVNDNNK